MLGRQPGPRVHQRDEALGQRDRDPGRHHRALAGGQGDVDRGEQVGAGVAGMGVRRQREVRVEALDQDLEVGGRGHVAGPYRQRARAPMTGFRRDRRPCLHRAPGRAPALVGAGHHAGRDPLARRRGRAPRGRGLDGHRRRPGRARRGPVVLRVTAGSRSPTAPSAPAAPTSPRSTSARSPRSTRSRRVARRAWTRTPAPTCCSGPISSAR